MTRTKRSRAQVSHSARRNALRRWNPGLADALPARLPAAPLEPGTLVVIGDYDRILSTPVSWQDARARESVVAELLANERARGDLAALREGLFTAAEVAERDRQFEDVALAALGRIPDAMAEQANPERRSVARARGRELIAEIRRTIAKQVRRGAGEPGAGGA